MQCMPDSVYNLQLAFTHARSLHMLRCGPQGLLPREQIMALGPDLKQQAMVRQQMAAAGKRGGLRSKAAQPLPQPLTADGASSGVWCARERLSFLRIKSAYATALCILT